MTTCSERVRVQDYLDGELDPGTALAGRAHLAGCAECAAEVAAFERVIVSLERAPLATPPARLTARILDEVLPSRRRVRRLAALGWVYAGSVAVCAAAGTLWWRLDPGLHATLGRLSTAVSGRLVGLGLFALNALGSAAVRLADGWGVAHAVGSRMAPLSRALGEVVAQPGIGLAIWAAGAACAGLLWWMRPRPRPAVREVHHVGVLGF